MSREVKKLFCQFCERAFNYLILIESCTYILGNNLWGFLSLQHSLHNKSFFLSLLTSYAVFEPGFVGILGVFSFQGVWKAQRNNLLVLIMWHGRVWGQNRTALFSPQLHHLYIRTLDKPCHPQFGICTEVETSIFHFCCTFLRTENTKHAYGNTIPRDCFAEVQTPAYAKMKLSCIFQFASVCKLINFSKNHWFTIVVTTSCKDNGKGRYD